MQPSFIKRFPASCFIAALGLLAGLTGCQPTGGEHKPQAAGAIAGQVFVVARSGESLRLGSVRVQIFEEEAIQAHMNEKERRVSERLEELDGRLARLKASASAQTESVARAEEAYRGREAQIQMELMEFVEESEEQRAFLKREMASNAFFIEFKDHFPPLPDGVPTAQEFNEYDARRKKWLSMDRTERGAWAEVLTSLNQDLAAEIAKLAAAREKKVFAFADELRVLDEQIITTKKTAAAAQEAVEVAMREREKVPGYADYLADLPSPLCEIRTDADGEFHVQLPPETRYVVYAQTERQLEGEQVHFRWFVRAGEDQPGRVLLSNHNLITSEASENVIKLLARIGQETDTSTAPAPDDA